MPAPCSEVRDLLVSTKLKAVLHEHKTVVVLKESATVEQALTVCFRARSAMHALWIACQGHGQGELPATTVTEAHITLWRRCLLATASCQRRSLRPQRAAVLAPAHSKPMPPSRR